MKPGFAHLRDLEKVRNTQYHMLNHCKAKWSVSETIFRKHDLASNIKVKLDVNGITWDLRCKKSQNLAHHTISDGTGGLFLKQDILL